MKEKIVEYFKKRGEEALIKYLDPSYMIRWASFANYVVMHFYFHSYIV